MNHQWSKGEVAEALLHDALRRHAGRPTGCFSLLRVASELHIAQLFATTTELRHGGDQLQLRVPR